MASENDWSIEVERRKDGGTFEHLTWGSWKRGEAPRMHSTVVPAEAVESLQGIAFSTTDIGSTHEIRIGEWTYRFVLTAA